MDQTLIDPSAIESHERGTGYEDDTVVLVSRAEWVAGHTPVAGIKIEGRLNGAPIDQAAVEGGDFDAPETETAITAMRLAIVAEAGMRPLRQLRQQIEAAGDPEDLIAIDPQLRDMILRRIQQDGPTDAELALLAQVKERTEHVRELSGQYGRRRWLLVAHLYRHGMPVPQIARLIERPPTDVERWIMCVPTAGAALVAGMESKTWAGYLARGRVPTPDDYIGREPVWHLQTIMTYLETRPGKPGRPAKR